MKVKSNKNSSPILDALFLSQVIRHLYKYLRLFT